MFTVDFKYSGKTIKIKPYNTDQEKNFLLLDSLGTPSVENALMICGFTEKDLETFSEHECIALLIKLREISVGEKINIKFKCKECGSPNENELDITNIITSSNITDDRITDQFKPLTEDNFNDFVDVDVEELDIDVYEELYEKTKESITKFNFVKPVVCLKCSKKNWVKVNDIKFLLDNLSEDSLLSIYQTYNDLTFYGRYTKQDVDTLYPFERSILISLLNKTREELNK